MSTVVAVTMLLGWAAGRAGNEAFLYIAAVVAPGVAACAIPIVVLREMRRGRPGHDGDVLLLVRLAAELRAGSTLRAAVAQLAEEDSRFAGAGALARAGRPMTGVFDALEPVLGRFGVVSVAALRMAAATGGSVAPVVEQLVVQVMALDDLERERRAAMAPVLLQAFIVGGVPLASLVAMAISGRLVGLAAEGPWHAGMVLVGAVLILVGAGLVARISLRSVPW